MEQDKSIDRIKRLKRRYLKETPVISIERARLFTEKWNSMDSLAPNAIKASVSMRHVYENMGFHIDPDDRIAGTWTENFLGIPVDIERGLFNNVFKTELDVSSMLFYQVKSNAGFLLYMFRRHGIANFFQNLEKMKGLGIAMPSIGLSTMDKRKINPYTIKPEDKRILQKELLPFWKGKTLVDKIKTALDKSDIHRGELESLTAAMPQSTSRNDMVISAGAALGTWQGHLILDHETPIRKGLLAMKDEVSTLLSATCAMAEDEYTFLKSIETALEGVIVFSKRLAEKLANEFEKESDPARKHILSEMHGICLKVPLNPARTFREAVQAYWTVKTAVELAVPFNVHAPGRLDQIFYPYYMNDLKEGLITEEEASTLLQELFLKIMSHNMRPYSNFTAYFTQRYEGSEPVTMGGLTRDGKDATNELTYVMLDAAAQSKASLNFAVRVHKDSPKELMEKVAELHSKGNSSISIMNDEIGVKALIRHGFSQEDAFDYAVTGCVDMCSPGRTGGEAFSSILLCRTLDMTLRNGDAQVVICLVKDAGIKTGDPDSFRSFDEFLDAFFAQAALQIENIAKASYIRDRVHAENMPVPLISAFIQGCLDKRKDVTLGGAVYDLEGILFMNSIANLIDSLYVIKKYVYEQKRFTVKKLLEAIDSNFIGFEDMHRQILSLEGKWGNANPESDELARKVMTRLFEEACKYRTYKGGIFAPFINSMTAHTYDGRIFIATPDGRKAAKPFAASCNPYNVDTKGPTGVLKSVASLDYSHVLGCAVNIRMHPSGIGETEEIRKKWISLIDTYFRMGGEQVQPTVVSTEVLRAAQKDPDAYGDVIVKVGGYSAYFVDLGYEIQEEIISRSEHRRT
ncbi:MAG TPA: pyruvate formate lyase family protein [Desulfomonilia bacterium]